MTKDLTEGRPFRLIFGFSVPVLLGYLFQQFYNVVDTVIVGQFLGKNALAAVGSTGSINFLIIGFCCGVCGGFAIPVAQKFGAKDYKTMRQFVAGSAFLSVIFSIVIAVTTALLCRPLLILMRTPTNILDNAASYIRIIFIGIPTVYLYNLLAGILRSLGDSKTPLVFLVISSVLNIALDLLFILIFKMGVEGAAWATVISQGVSGFACYIYMRKKFLILHLSRDDKKIRPHQFVTLLRHGLPMGLQYSITAVGSVILQSAVNTLGSDFVAASAAALKIAMFFCCPFDALGTTMATWGGQNVGAGKLTRLKSGLRDSTIIGSVYAIAVFFVMYFFGDNLALLFLDSTESAIIANVRRYLVLNSATYILLALVNIVRFLIQGMGFSILAVFAGVAEMIARTLAALVLVPMIGYTGACLASPIAWVFADIFLIPAFFVCYKKLEKWEKEHRVVDPESFRAERPSPFKKLVIDREARAFKRYFVSFPSDVQLCIFDMDGTLVDSVNDIALSINHVFTRRGFAPLSSDFVRSAVGIGAKNLVARCLAAAKGYKVPLEAPTLYMQDAAFAAETEALLETYRPEYEIHCMDTTKLRVGVRTLLNYLSEHGIELAVYTNKPQAATEKMLKALEIAPLFTEVMCPESAGARKPSPVGITKILEKTGIEKKYALMVGDSITDVMTAKKADVRVLAVTGGYCDEMALRSSSPDYMV